MVGDSSGSVPHLNSSPDSDTDCCSCYKLPFILPWVDWNCDPAVPKSIIYCYNITASQLQYASVAFVRLLAAIKIPEIMEISSI